MLGVGWTEMLVIGIVALIVIGPKDLPVLMQRLGKIVGTVRRMGSEFQREINKTTGLDQVRDLRKSITEPLRQTGADIAREFNAMAKDGTMQPTGVLKPTDPKVESVYDSIQKAVGMAPEPSVTPVPAKKPAATVKPKAPARAKPVVTKPVTTAQLAPVKVAKPVVAKPVKAAAKKPKTAEPSPAPAEAIAPVVAVKPKKPAKPKAAAPALVAKPKKAPAKPRAEKS